MANDRDRRVDDDDRELRLILQGIRDIHSAVIPMVDNIHRDVHHIRGDFRDAVEKSQTAIMNRLSLMDAKLDRITSGEVVTEADKALARDIRDTARAIKTSVKALDDKTPSAAEPGVNG